MPWPRRSNAMSLNSRARALSYCGLFGEHEVWQASAAREEGKRLWLSADDLAGATGLGPEARGPEQRRGVRTGPA